MEPSGDGLFRCRGWRRIDTFHRGKARMTRLTEILKRRSPVVNTLSPDQTVAEAARVMADRHVGAVLLVEGGRLVGIFSERDLLQRVVVQGASPERTPLRTAMTRDPITAGPGD